VVIDMVSDKMKLILAALVLALSLFFSLGISINSLDRYGWMKPTLDGPVYGGDYNAAYWINIPETQAMFFVAGALFGVSLVYVVTKYKIILNQG